MGPVSVSYTHLDVYKRQGPGSVDPYNPKVVRGSMGAILRLPVWAENWEVIHRLTDGLDVWLAAARDGVAYTAVDWQRPAALLIGSEAQGAGAQAERLATGRVTIPMRDATESVSYSHLDVYKRQRLTRPSGGG